MSANPPVVKIHYGATYENVLDITQYIKELRIIHEDIDSKNSGRDTDTGIMVREIVKKVHTLEVALRRVTQSELHDIHVAVQNISNPFFQVEYRGPCTGVRTRLAYVSTMNFGAQRYNKRTGNCYYDGATFKIIERGED